jgi:outer membrane protein insertion porin family
MLINRPQASHLIGFLPKNSVFLVAFWWLFVVNSTFAKSTLDIEITGLQRIEESSILPYFEDLKNDKNLSKNLDKIEKNLYETEFFSEIDIANSQSKLIVKFVENPIIYETKFIGNKKISEEILSTEVSLKKRSIFTKSKLQSDIKRLNEIYIKSGRFLTKIEPKIIQKEQNRIELIYEIDEGPKAKIGEIYFIGNSAFSDRELAEQISTKKSIWWKFFSSSDIYDSDRLEYDKELLRRFYNNSGFADFTTISSMAQINRTKDSFFITFLVEEGIKYKIGDINIINQISGFDPEILYSKITFKTKDFYNAQEIENSINLITDELSSKSYAFAVIEPILKRNKDNKTIDIDFVINETPRIFIDKINIYGNSRTQDEVIRRELRIREGDPFNNNKINRSKQRLENLGYFEKVEFNTKRINDTNLIDLEIFVKEKRTGELSMGLGYSTLDRLNVNAGIRENNLFGTGRKIGLNVQRSFANLSAEVNYTKPYFLGRPVDVGFDIHRTNSAKITTRAFQSNNSGFKLNAIYSIVEFLDHIASYSYNAQNISNIDSTASMATQMMRGSYIISAFENSLIYDKTDNRLDPKKGYFISLSQVYAGVGGNTRFSKYQGRASYFLPTFNNDFILRFMTRGGVIDGNGEDINIQNNYFLGGNDIRGFALFGIGPRVISDGNSGAEAVGGKIFYTGTAEFRFPLGLPRELGINGALFWDNGVLKSVDSSIKRQARISSSNNLRSSIGFSVFWSSPMGPIRLDFARVLKQEAYDRTQVFNLNLGTNFF